MKTAEGAKVNVAQQVQLGLLDVNQKQCFVIITVCSVLLMKWISKEFCCSTVCLFATLPKVNMLLYAFAGIDAAAVPLHNGSRARHQEQFDFPKDFGTNTSPLLPSMDPLIHTKNLQSVSYLSCCKDGAWCLI